MWSLEAAFECKFPMHDVDGKALHGQAGKELAGGLKFVLWSLKADLDHWAKAYELTHYKSNDLCEFCNASRKNTIGKAGTIILALTQHGKQEVFQQCNGDNCTIPMNFILSFSCHICLATIWKWMVCM